MTVLARTCVVSDSAAATKPSGIAGDGMYRQNSP
jgi:hypothetical protein